MPKAQGGSLDQTEWGSSAPHCGPPQLAARTNCTHNGGRAGLWAQSALRRHHSLPGFRGVQLTQVRRAGTSGRGTGYETVRKPGSQESSVQSSLHPVPAQFLHKTLLEKADDRKFQIVHIHLQEFVFLPYISKWAAQRSLQPESPHGWLYGRSVTHPGCSRAFCVDARKPG